MFTVKFTKSGRADRDGCFVDVVELGNGSLKLTLRSNFDPSEIVDEQVVSKDRLVYALDSWADY